MSATATKSEHHIFNITGKYMTNLINSLMDEGRIKFAMQVTEDCGVPPEMILETILRKKIMQGSLRTNDLHLEDVENSEEQQKWFKTWLDIRCKKFALITRQIAMIQERCYWASLLPNYDGIIYRSGDDTSKFTNHSGHTRTKDLKEMNHLAEEIADLTPLITDILPIIGESVNYLNPYFEIADKNFEQDYEHIEKMKTSPFLVTNMQRDVKQKNFQAVKEFPVRTHDSLGQKYFEPKTIGGLDDVVGLPRVKPATVVVPYGIDMEIVDTAWISPDGKFYGRFGTMADFIHKDLADEFQEAGMIPADHKNPDEWLENDGWLKISHGRILYHNIKLDVTNAQRETLKAYAKHRNLPYLEIGMLRKKLRLENIDSVSSIDLMQ